MNMKTKVFLAHDPGGYDVVYPVFKKYQESGLSAEFYCVGPVAKLAPDFAVTEQELMDVLSERLLPNMSVLVTGTSWGDDFELMVIKRSKKEGIKTVAILDYWSNYALRLKDKQQTAVYPDYYLVMDELAKKEAIQDGVPAKILYELGHPGLDRFVHLGSFKDRVDQDKSQRKALFLCQPLSQLYGDSLGYTESNALSECYNAFSSSSNWSFDVKFHPKDNEHIQNSFKQCTVDGNLLDLIPEYDVTVGMNSMGLLHSILLGVPAISYQPNLRHSDLCITNKLGLTPLLTHYDDLAKYINDEQTIIQLNKKITNAKQEIPWLDGKSTERIFSFIEGL